MPLSVAECDQQIKEHVEILRNLKDQTVQVQGVLVFLADCKEKARERESVLTPSAPEHEVPT
jgi:hypothetical protein